MSDRVGPSGGGAMRGGPGPEPDGAPQPTERLYAIVEQGLCIGCGICRAVAGPETIAVITTAEHNLRPLVIGDLDHRTVDAIYDVCPGTTVDGLPDRLVDDVTTIDPVWGPWRRMVRAWAGDPQVRHEGSTGGVLTALAQYLLRSGRVEAVLHTRASDDEPTFGQATVSRSGAQVLAAAGSRYGPTATLSGIDAVLEREEPIAFVGKPCDIGALRNLARRDPRVDRLVRYWLTPVCGGYGPPAFTDRFLAGLGVDRSELTGFGYRGRGCPGPTVASTEMTTIERHYLDYWGDDESQWSLPWRCKICPDGIGESADIVAADTWPGGSPTREGSATDPGTNAIIARTAAGIELLEAAAADGALVIEHDIGPEELSAYQPHQVNKKQAVYDRFRGLADEGRIVPRWQRLRLDELARSVPVVVRQRQREGTRQRIQLGKAAEVRPARPAPDQT